MALVTNILQVLQQEKLKKSLHQLSIGCINEYVLFSVYLVLFSHSGSLDQVVPGGDDTWENSDCCCTRQLPSIVTKETKELQLFDGGDIFASREE